MMKSAIDWLMGKSESVSISSDLNTIPATHGFDQEISHSDGNFSKENSVINGFSPVEKMRKPNGEEVRSPWGRTLTPKSPKYMSQLSPKPSSSSARINSSHASPKRMMPPVPWEEMSFASDVMSPGFATRIAKEARGSGGKMYDGSRRYPIGQEKYMRPGVLPNVRLKGHAKPVVMARRAPTSPLLPLASPSSPFSSSSLASGFLASASTRMPDISSVVSVLDSTPSTSAYETINDPTSVQAVIAALEQAQSIKSGIKRTRYGETEDSNKKQKCAINTSLENLTDFSTPIMTQAFNSGGGEKRALDLSPPSSTSSAENFPSSDRPQLSPENKRRCIPDPRIASFSSSKNIANHSLNLQSSGRETPFSIYESHQDSDSESNKSLESHQSRQSERSSRGQTNDPSCGRASSSNQEQTDRSGSQTPQSVRGSYGLGANNGSNASSRTNTPSRPSHIFSLEAYKSDKAKSHQRLNKMLGMLFNVSDDEIQVSNQTASSSSVAANDAAVVSAPSSASDLLIKTSSIPASSGLLREVLTNSQTDVPSSSSSTTEHKSKENKTSETSEADVSTSFTFTLKPTTSKENGETKSIPNNVKEDQAPDPPISVVVPQLPSYQESVSSTPSSSCEAVSNSKPLATNSETLPISSLISTAFTSLINAPEDKQQTLVKETSTSASVPSPTFTPFSFSSPTSTPATSSNPLEALKTATFSISKSPPFSFAPNSTATATATNTAPTLAPFSFGKENASTDTVSTGLFSKNVVTSKANQSDPKSVNLFSFGAKATSPSSMLATATATTSATSLPDVEPIFAQPSVTAESENKNSTKESPLGLFNFGVSSAAPNFSTDKTSVTVTSQPQNSAFKFDASLPSSTLVSTMPPTSTASVPSLFSFGSSQLPAVSSNSPTVEMNTPPINTESIPKTSSSSLGFSFNSSQSGVNKLSSLVTTSSSVFGGNIFSFGPSAPKPSVIGSMQPPASQTEVSPSSTASGIFTFGDASKPAVPSNTTPFQFNTPTSTIAPPTFGSTVGGGFSFGNIKPTVSSSTVPQFGTTNTAPTSTASTFSYNAASPTLKQATGGFDFSTPKTSASTASSNLFSFGSSNAQFGSAPNSTAGNGFGQTSTPKLSSNFSFGSDKPAIPAFGAQSAPSFGTPDMGNKGASKTLFGGIDTTNPAPAFGSTNTASPFGMSQTQNPFNTKSAGATFGSFGAAKSGTETVSSSATFGAFGAPKSGTESVSAAATFGSFGSPKPAAENVSVVPPSVASSAPNANPFQMGQTPSPAPFPFGQAPAPTSQQPGVFLFGSAGNPSPAPAVPNFGAGNFNFGGGAGGGTNMFSVGASNEPPSAPRRPKARAYRRK